MLKLLLLGNKCIHSLLNFAFSLKLVRGHQNPMLVSTQSTTMMTHNIVVLKIKLCPSFTICSYFFKYRNSRSTVRVAKKLRGHYKCQCSQRVMFRTHKFRENIRQIETFRQIV